MLPAAFVIPSNVPHTERVAYCTGILEKQHAELVVLRKKQRACEYNHTGLEKQIQEWEEQYKNLSEELKKEQQENNKLRKEIEKLTKTNERYRVALFDHGNFKRPGKNGKKPKGGQIGHANTNKDTYRNYASFPRLRIFAASCAGCGSPLERGGGIKEKTLLDIEINPKILQVIVQSERQWCGNCKIEVRASHPQSLPFTEYGINTFMTVMYLRFKGKQSVRTIAGTFNSLFGLPIAKSGVDSLLAQAKGYLQEKYEELKQAIREGDIMYNDETGWTVRGQSACMWIMASPDKKQQDGTIKSGMTVYVAAESKGKGIFEEMYGSSKARSMHDGNPSYVAITGEENTLYCWSHMLRFAYEEAVKLPPLSPASRIRDRLADLYQTIRAHPEWIREQKETALREEIDALLAIRADDQAVINILFRLGKQKEGLIPALLVTEDGTNNLAEREFRPLVTSRNISYGSDTYGGMETTAILGSIVQTIGRDKTKPFFPTLASYLQEGVRKKHPRHKQIPLFDT